MKKNILLLFIILIVTASCSAHGNGLRQSISSTAKGVPNQSPTYRIHSGDQLEIKFFYNLELNESVVVRPDGKISLQLVDDIRAAGMTPSELDELLTQKYSKELRRPVLTVIVKSFTAQKIYIGGEIERPGLYDLPGDMMVIQAVFNAGGFKETAKPEAAIVIRKGPDGQPIPLRVNLKQVVKGERLDEDIYLQPQDIVYIPKSFIAKANKFVRQYIKELLLYNGFDFGIGWYGDTNSL